MVLYLGLSVSFLVVGRLGGKTTAKSYCRCSCGPMKGIVAERPSKSERLLLILRGFMQFARKLTMLAGLCGATVSHHIEDFDHV